MGKWEGPTQPGVLPGAVPPSVSGWSSPGSAGAGGAL